MSGKKRSDKPPIEMNSAELAERLFGHELKVELDQIAHEKDAKPDTTSPRQE